MWRCPLRLDTSATRQKSEVGGPCGVVAPCLAQGEGWGRRAALEGAGCRRGGHGPLTSDQLTVPPGPRHEVSCPLTSLPHGRDALLPPRGPAPHEGGGGEAGIWAQSEGSGAQSTGLRLVT